MENKLEGKRCRYFENCREIVGEDQARDSAQEMWVRVYCHDKHNLCGVYQACEWLVAERMRLINELDQLEARSHEPQCPYWRGCQPLLDLSDHNDQTHYKLFCCGLYHMCNVYKTHKHNDRDRTKEL